MTLLSIIMLAAIVVAGLGLYLMVMAEAPDVTRGGAFMTMFGSAVIVICGIVMVFP